MSFYLYSPEDFPSKRKSNKSFQNVPEWLMFGNHKLYGVEAHKWVKLERKYEEQQYADFTDKRGSRVVILDDEFAAALITQFTNPESPNYGRGVKIVEGDDYKSPQVRKRVEAEAEEENRQFRARVVSEFEAQLAVYHVKNEGRPYTTPYEDECYEILNIPRPHSLEQLMLTRQPGVNIGRQIVQAMQEAQVQQAALIGSAGGMGASPADIRQASEAEVMIDSTVTGE